MSNANVESCRRWIDQFTAATTPEAVRAAVDACWDKDADYYPARRFPGAEPRHGSEEIADWLVAWRHAWDALEFRVVRIVPIGDVRVLTHMSVNAQGHETQAPVDGHLYVCTWMRAGLFLRSEDHLTEAGACRALGMEANSLHLAAPDG